MRTSKITVGDKLLFISNKNTKILILDGGIGEEADRSNNFHYTRFVTISVAPREH